MQRYLTSVYAFLLLSAFAFGIVSCSEDTVVGGADKPEIKSFTASPASVDIGSSTTLVWDVKDATSISIDNGVGVQTSTSVVIYPSQNTTYTLTATGDGGTSTLTTAVTVINPSDPGAPNNPTSLTAAPGNPGIVVLNWTASTGATKYQLERRSDLGFSLINTVAVNSATDAGLYPGTSYTYRVRALNGADLRSGWSNFVTVTAPGSTPVVSRVEITPANPTTLHPGESAQLTARAFDANNNDLGFSASIFTWTSSNTLVAPVSQTGMVLIPAAAQLGNAQITASIAGVSSTPVVVTVALQKATTLVIFHPKADGESFAIYTSAFGTTPFDVLYDRKANSTETTITLEQIENYERVFYFTHDDNKMHASTKSLLKIYSSASNKRLIVMGANQFSGDGSFLSLIGLSNESYLSASTINSSFVGGAGTVMAGFNFDLSATPIWVSTLTTSASAIATPAFSTTLISNGNPIISAVQTNVGANSKFFFAGFVLENVQQNLRDDFIQKLMGL